MSGGWKVGRWALRKNEVLKGKKNRLKSGGGVTDDSLDKKKIEKVLVYWIVVEREENEN